jgi:hypothetical protein
VSGESGGGRDESSGSRVVSVEGVRGRWGGLGCGYPGLGIIYTQRGD